MIATKIEWDVDCREDLEGLPTEIEIPEGMEDEEDISDYLSAVTGFCHKGFVLVDDRVQAVLDRVDQTRFTNSTNAVLSLDSIKGIEVVSLDLCYDNNKELPSCDAVSLVELPLTVENIQLARRLLSAVSEEFNIPARDDLAGCFVGLKAALGEQKCPAQNSLADKIRAAESEKDLQLVSELKEKDWQPDL